MVTNRLLGSAILLLMGTATAHEAASPGACRRAAVSAPILAAKDALAANPDALRAHFKLADAWSDAGCFEESLQVLDATEETHPGNQELETRRRVARSLVGEAHFFENLDRAEQQARIKRDTFRCTSLSDLEACAESAQLQADDAQAASNYGDALLKMDRPSDALTVYRRAAALNPELVGLQDKIKALGILATPATVDNPSVAVSSLKIPVRTARGPRVLPHYSNAEPEAHSH